MITDNFASLLSKSSVIIYQYKSTSKFIFSRTTIVHQINMAPLKRGPKGPMTGNGPLHATTQANYRGRVRKQQKDRLKNLRKK